MEYEKVNLSEEDKFIFYFNEEKEDIIYSAKFDLTVNIVCG